MPEEQPNGHIGLAAVAGQVIGLGREVESLRRMVDLHRGKLRAVDDQLGEVDGRVGSLAAALAGFADQLAELAVGEDGSTPITSWFDVDDAAVAKTRLVDLARWLDRVYLRFPDAVLPTCWLWHPSVVEELLWLRRSWLEAYTGRTAAAFRVADWHDRQRPGVIARIGALNGGVCSLDQHLAGAEQDRLPPTAGLASAHRPIAEWWTTRRDSAPPPPTVSMLAEAGEKPR